MQEWLAATTDTFITYIQSVEPIYAYLALTFTSFLENIFPPAPGDVITVFGASLVGIGHLKFHWVLLSTTIGSVAGFMFYFYIGKFLGRKFFLEKNYSFFPNERFIKTEEWFEKYGYKIIVANRFLSGLRSVISLFCGVSQLSTSKVILFSTLSAIAWNLILVSAGAALGSNWHEIKNYLSQYAQVITVLIVCVVIYLLVKRKLGKKAEL